MVNIARLSMNAMPSSVVFRTASTRLLAASSARLRLTSSCSRLMIALAMLRNARRKSPISSGGSRVTSRRRSSAPMVSILTAALVSPISGRTRLNATIRPMVRARRTAIVGNATKDALRSMSARVAATRSVSRTFPVTETRLSSASCVLVKPCRDASPSSAR